MKKIIDGKVYNTETAELICPYPPAYRYYRGDSRDNFHDTDLYRTKKGVFFLSGYGNAFSMWGKGTGGGWFVGGEGIRVVDDAEAREIVEKHGTVEQYEKLFGEPVEA